MKRTRLFLIALFVVMNAIVALTIIPTAQASALCNLYHTVQRGENLYRIGLRYNISVASLQAMNNLPNPNQIYVGQALCVQPAQPQTPPPSGATYTVQPGDNLYRIAQRFGVSLTSLANLNGIANPNRIYAGQVLRIPSGGNVPSGGLSVGALTMASAPNVQFVNGTYWIADANGFFPNVLASNAQGVAFYLRDQWGGITLLGEDTFGGDGWGVSASIPQNPFFGSIYAIAYNNRAEVVQSNLINVRR